MKIRQFKLTLVFDLKMPNAYQISKKKINEIKTEAVADLRCQDISVVNQQEKYETSWTEPTNIVATIEEMHASDRTALVAKVMSLIEDRGYDLSDLGGKTVDEIAAQI